MTSSTSTDPTVASLPRDHHLRRLLNDEIHARPPERLVAPCRVSFVALLADAQERQRTWDKIVALALELGSAPPESDAAHYSADFGPFRIKAERHTEFLRIKIISRGYGGGDATRPFVDPAWNSLPSQWIDELHGKTICAIHVVIMPGSTWPPNPAMFGEELLPTDRLVGSLISGGVGAAFTDLRIREDGFSRVLILDHGMTPGQIGRSLQRLVEMDSYRMLALLAFPIARARMPELSVIENDLASVTAALVEARDEVDRALLDRLTRLAAQIESRQSETQFRFAAAASYHVLVEQRIQELREERMEGLQTFREFMERRLAPAMRTCRVVSERQESLSARVARATELLSTRVELSSQQQSHELLDSMNRRAQLQLRLQETVEGLSVAAVTYYIVALVGHAAEGLEAEGLRVNPALTMGVSIPIVAILVALGVRRIRKSVAHAFEKPKDD